MNPPHPNTNAAANIDLLRAMAAFFVAFGHTRLMLIYDAESLNNLSLFQKSFYFLTNLGGESVLVFFVLSGFLVGSSVFRDIQKNKFYWTKYTITRASRLYVVLIPAILIGVVIDLTGSFLFSKSIVYSTPFYGVMLPANVLEAINFKIALGNLLFTQEILVPTLGSNHPLWSLTNEAWYYVIFPFYALGLLYKVSNLKRFCFLFVATAILFYVLPEKISILFSAWLIGALIYFLPKIKTKIWHSLSLLSLLIVWTALRSLKFHDGNSLITSILTALLIYSLAAQESTSSLTYIKISKNIAAISFSLYLFHTPFIVLLSALTLTRNVKLNPDLEGVFFCIAVCAAAILYSSCMYYLFERNTVNLRNIILRKFNY